MHGQRRQRTRLAFDGGSSVSLMSERLAAALHLKHHSQEMELDGLTGGGRARHCVQATLRSLHADERVTLWFGVVSRIPHATVPKSAEQILSAPILRDKKPLADPALGGSLDLHIGSCDIIKCVTGADVYSKMAEISATPTLFGWSIVAPIDSDQAQTVLKVRVSEDPLHEALQQMWELERVPEEPVLSKEDQIAMDYFDETHSRQSDGRYVVRLPQLNPTPKLGTSRLAAVQRLVQSEQSLEKKDLLSKFREVPEEYRMLDHAELVPHNQLSRPNFYLPVQVVTRESTTTKLRAIRCFGSDLDRHIVQRLLAHGTQLVPQPGGHSSAFPDTSHHIQCRHLKDVSGGSHP